MNAAVEKYGEEKVALGMRVKTLFLLAGMCGFILLMGGIDVGIEALV